MEYYLGRKFNSVQGNRTKGTSKSVNTSDPKFPYSDPIVKARDMKSHNYGLEETLFQVKKDWKGIYNKTLTQIEINQIKQLFQRQ